MCFPGPVNGIAGDGVGHLPYSELLLGLAEVVTAFHEAQGEPTSSLSLIGGVWRFFEEGLVSPLKMLGEAQHLTAVEWGHASANLEAVCSNRTNSAEACGALDGARQGTVTSAPMAEPEFGGDGCQVEGGFSTVLVECISEVAKKEGCGRAENAEPVCLDVSRPGVMAELVE